MISTDRPWSSFVVGGDWGSSTILTTCMAGTRISESSSLDWIAEGRGAVDRTPTKVCTVAGLKVMPSSYIYHHQVLITRDGRGLTLTKAPRYLPSLPGIGYFPCTSLGR
jgi:hypothetical protein